MAFSQFQLRNFIFSTIEDANNAGRPGEVCYVLETNSWYRAKYTDIAPDNKDFLATSYPEDHGLNLIWTKIKSNFEPWRDPVESHNYSDPADIPLINPGARFIVKPAGAGDWFKRDNQIAVWENEKWHFAEPRVGDIVVSKEGFGVYKYVYNEADDIFEWVNILDSFAQMIDINYTALVQEIENRTLRPGTYYRILDYHTENWVDSSRSAQHISENEPIVVLALSNDTVSTSAFSTVYSTDEISYSVESLVSLNGRSDQLYQNTGPEGGGWGPTTNVYNRITAAGFTDSENINGSFEDDYTINIPGVNLDQALVRVGDDTQWRPVDGEDISYDGTDLVLSNGLTFKYTDAFNNQRRRVEFSNIRIADEEYPNGKIYYRKDVQNNIIADYDFRNFKFRRYLSHADANSQGTDDYYLWSSNNEQYWQLDENYYGYTSSETYADREPVINCRNVEITGTRYTTLSNVNNSSITLVAESSLYSGDFLKIRDSYNVVLNAGARISDLEILESTHVFTDSIAFNGIVVLPIDISNTKVFSSSKIYLGSSGTSSVEFNKVRNFGAPQQVRALRNCKVSGIYSSTKIYSGYTYNFSDSTIQLGNLDLNGNVSINDSEFIVNSAYNTSFSGSVDRSVINASFYETSIVSDILNSKIDVPLIRATQIEYPITNNIYSVDRDHTLYPFIQTVNADATNVETTLTLTLPDYPNDGQRVTVLDIGGIASTKNIIINVASNPSDPATNTINGSNSYVLAIDYGVVTIQYSDASGWFVITESVVTHDPDNVTIGLDVNDHLTIKNINLIIDEDGESIDGSDTPMQDANTELVTRAYVDKAVEDSKSLHKIRLLESVYNVDLNNPPAQVDYTDVNNMDIVGLFAQDNPVENGIYVADYDNGWYRWELLPTGASVASIVFAVEDGCLNEDTLWMFTNNTGEDIVDTNELHARQLSTDGSIQKIEQIKVTDVDEANQFIQLGETPLPNKHFQVYLWGQLLMRGNGFDYDVANDRVVFYNGIEEGDQIAVYYYYREGEFCVPPAPPSPYLEFDLVIQSGQEDFQMALVSVPSGGEVEIDWGDGYVDTYGTTQNNLTHTYSDIGTYSVKIKGYDWLRFNDGSITDYDWNITIRHWGDWSLVTNAAGMFAYMNNIFISTDDTFYPPNEISISDMFKDSPNFNDDISDWNITNVTSIDGLFDGAESFNQSINTWAINNGKIDSLARMFRGASAFNQPLNIWNISNITSLEETFNGATNFNQPLDTWDTSNVTNMVRTFQNAVNFNQNISNWNIDNVQYCTDFMTGSALTCDNAPYLPASCTGCYNKFKMEVTVISDDQLALNIQGSSDTELEIDWGDGNVENHGITTSTSQYIHTYTASGTYLVTVRGHQYLRVDPGTGSNKNLTVKHWGDNRAWTNLRYMFASVRPLYIDTDDVLSPANDVNAENMFDGCADLNSPIGDLIDTSNFTNMQYFLRGCNVFNQPVENWNTAKVTNMRSLFERCYEFNQPLTNWDTSSVTDMTAMFSDARKFNQPVDHFVVNNVTSMDYMFRSAFEFNQPLDSWDTASLTRMAGMFNNAYVFNQPLNHFKVDNVVSLASTFNNARTFNQDLNNWNTGNVTSLYRTFLSAYEFNGDITTWDTSSVADMYETFYHAYKFNQNINNWDTGNVTRMLETFRDARVFNQPLSNWNTSNVTDMGYMFNLAYDFNQDLSTWDTSKVENFHSMFERATDFNGNVTTWDVSSGTDFASMFASASNFAQDLSAWNPSSGVTFAGMFNGAVNWDSDVSNWDMSNAQNLSYMFSNSGFTGAGLETWNTSNVTNLQATFRYLSNFNGDVSGWDTSKVTTMRETFRNNTNFNGVLSGWDTSSVTNMSYMFSQASSFNRDISSWNVSNVTDFSYMFDRATSFNQPLDNWDVSAAVTFNHMFSGASSFNQPLGSWNITNATDLSYMFNGASSFNQNLNTWNTSNVENMYSVFYSATAFNGDIGPWNTSKVTNMGLMFASATNFARDISGWDVSNVTNMQSMFNNADSFNIDISNWNTGNVTNMSYMFNNNDAFNQDISGWDVTNVQYCTNFRGGTSVLECANTPALPTECTGC